MRIVTTLFLLFYSSALFAQEVTETATSTSQSAYYVILIELAFQFALQLAQIIGILFLALILWSYLMALFNPNKVAQQNRTIVTFPKIIGGVMICYLIYAPINAVIAINDFTGLVNEADGRSLCLVVDVSSEYVGWENDAESCLDQVKASVSELASYSSEDSIEFARLDVWGGLIQLLSLVFFLMAGSQLWMKLYGIREVRMTYTACIFAMIFSSAGMAIFNAIDYIQDFRGQGEYVTS
ncbi:hypothetical protein [Alteromonas sp. 14N.309.X.WAT.G.H12]|uniref:hypothetical protein n=1 Tax=Alteromonas sp. 14N.309.X.WAT.G.H12 TaxID=3120824 RepID=UPI002FD50B3A